MNKDETLKICFILQSAYPQHYDRFGDHERRAMSEIWNAVLADYDYQTVCAGVKAYIANDVKGFPPSPGQIIDHIHKLTERPENRLTESQAWALVYKALCNGLYGAEKEFEKLPPIVQRAVGSPDVLRQWAQEENVSVTQSNFERAYRVTQDRHREEAKLPESVKALAIGLAERLPQIAG